MESNTLNISKKCLLSRTAFFSCDEKCLFFFSKRKYYLLKWFILYFKTLNLHFLLAVHEYVRQRGLTAAELFGSWTRWPRLPDASLTQGQNPEWKPLMFFERLPTPLFRSLSLQRSPRTYFLPLSFSSLSALLSPPLSPWFTLSFPPLRFSLILSHVEIKTDTKKVQCLSEDSVVSIRIMSPLWKEVLRKMFCRCKSDLRDLKDLKNRTGW